MSTDPSGTRLDYARDFRAEAATASLAAIARLALSPASADLTAAGLSLCVPSDVDAATTRRSLSIALISYFASVLAGLIVGGLIVFAAIHPTVIAGQVIRAPVWIGVLISGFAWLGVCSSVDFENLLIRIFLRGRKRPLLGSPPRGIPVKLEDPRTARSVKLVVEDFTLLSCDRDRRLIALEGVFYRYVIRAEDILSCGLFKAPAARYVVLAVRIAESDVVLTLALSHNGLLQELARQLTFGTLRPRLAGVLERTFQLKIDRIVSLDPFFNGGRASFDKPV